MKFTAQGRSYEIDTYGVVNQMDCLPFVYDSNYCSIYDTPEYKDQSDYLQALRLGFCLASHGRKPKSICDIGYGNGAFMLQAKKHIPYVYGVDLTGIQVEGCYIMPEFIKAEIYTLHDAFEHFHDLSFIRYLPAETVIISLPYCHIITEGIEWFEKKYKHLKSDEHVHHFNEISLGNIMDHFGWRKIASSTHEDIVRKSTHGLDNILTMSFKKK